jgi:hypothetical protein
MIWKNSIFIHPGKKFLPLPITRRYLEPISVDKEFVIPAKGAVAKLNFSCEINPMAYFQTKRI